MVQMIRDNVARTVVVLLMVVLAYGWFGRPPVSWTFGLVVLVGCLGAFLTDARYAARRLAAVIPILVLVSFIVFALMNSLPGDPAINILGPSATPDAVAQVRAELGLDEPFFARYGGWLGDAVVGDLGTSVQRREAIAVGMSKAMTPTLQLAFYSFMLALVLALPLGVLSAYRQGRMADRVSNYTMLGFLAAPNFVLAVVLVLFFSVGGISVFGFDVGWKILPAARYVPLGDDWFLHFKHMLLPAIALAMPQAAVFMRLLRSDMILTLRLPFIDLARSKGVTTSRILWLHALRPSSFTLLTVVGLTLGALLGGTLIIEAIFTLPGVGNYIFQGVGQRDYIAVQGGVLVISALFITLLTMSDFLYLALDPRLRSERD